MKAYNEKFGLLSADDEKNQTLSDAKETVEDSRLQGSQEDTADTTPVSAQMQFKKYCEANRERFEEKFPEMGKHQLLAVMFQDFNKEMQKQGEPSSQSDTKPVKKLKKEPKKEKDNEEEKPALKKKKGVASDVRMISDTRANNLRDSYGLDYVSGI